MLRHLSLAGLLLLAACAGQPQRPASPPPAPQAPPAVAPATPVPQQPPPPPARAADATPRVVPMPELPAPQAALAAFRSSCPALLNRDDLSGLTRREDWQAACTAADAATDAAGFFRNQFAAVAVADGSGFATGYYEPEIAASLTRQPGYEVPIWRRPPDLIDVPLGDFATSLKGRTVRGRVQGRRLVPYPPRAEIDAVLAGKGLELAFAADPFEAFFLEIQGSGRLRLPDGRVIRIGYDGQNGRDYVAIGRLLVERGALERGQAGMAEIIAWLRGHPAEAPAILNANPSKIFFRVLEGDGPIGALGVAVAPRVSIAADPAFVPLGAPVLVETTLTRSGQPFAALMVAQDTGGAIKGANRIDLFLGPGAEAAADAGAQSAPARITLLLPIAAAARLAP